MKRVYSSPEMEIEKFSVESSVLCTSTATTDPYDPDTDIEF